ncbi:arylsulfatase B-like [Littorina saxatilis]|uniref:Sulfatase N-terminal domain-containing protein n=1 Tax=Littorina saxatilis TaxID=31220 RepID=A0AAN9G0E0_9CAEN
MARPLAAWLLLAALSVTSHANSDVRAPPNIILMVGDDIGWADVQRHDPEMRTPNLERMATRGRELTHNYVLPTCAPTRSALLTARYPYTYGMQVNDITGTRLAWLNETLTLLPATMRDLGYRTHMIGKWHLGFCDWSLTPTRRGFDSFYGFFSGAQGYFNHSGNGDHAYDFRDNDEIVWSARGHYSTELHTARAQSIIRNSSASNTPFFLYMAYQNAHAPWEVKQDYVDRYCSHVTNDTRRLHCGMVAAMDESIGNITQTLQDEGVYDNTIVVFMSDNGGPIGGSAFNWPLRGQKATLWEGGVRSYTVIDSPLITQQPGQGYDGLFHAVDWYPTLVTAAGGSPPAGQDGIAMWQELLTNTPTPTSRDEFVYNIDDKNRRAALRWNKWKLTQGKPGRKYNGWYPPPSLLRQGEAWEEVKGRTLNRWQLFDLDADPAERYDVSEVSSNMGVVATMKRKLNDYRRRLQPYDEAPRSRLGSQLARQNGAYTPGFCNPSEGRPRAGSDSRREGSEQGRGGRNRGNGGRNRGQGGRNRGNGGRNRETGGRNRGQGGRNRGSGGRNQGGGGRRGGRGRGRNQNGGNGI